MRRREFTTALVTSGLYPRAAFAQKAPVRKKIAFLSGADPSVIGPILSSFTDGMQALGYVEGRDYEMLWRFTAGRHERFPEIAREVVALGVDVIVLGTPVAARPAMDATRTIPIVMGISADPVGNAFVQSLARPGGNVTGLASLLEDTVTKQVELLALLLPRLGRLGILHVSGPNTAAMLPRAEAAARRIGAEVVAMSATPAAPVEAAFATFAQQRVEAVLSIGDGWLMQQRELIARLALERRLPAMFGQREYAVAGGLMSYGEDLRQFFRRAATFVDKIFRGANPSELPVEQPTRFHLVINQRTATALGLEIPMTLLTIADEVIE